MDKAAKPSIGIYDKRALQRQMLHHNLERMQHEVLYSCSDLQEFIHNYLIHPVDIILHNADGGIDGADQILSQLNGSRKKVSVLFYYGCAYANEVAELKKKYETALFTCKGRWEDIILSLDSLLPQGIKEAGSSSPVTISPENPFYNIATNKTCVRILELLREGKNVKQVSAITGMPVPTVNYYIKKMRQETGCSSVVELVMDAKETGVL